MFRVTAMLVLFAVVAATPPPAFDPLAPPTHLHDHAPVAHHHKAHHHNAHHNFTPKKDSAEVIALKKRVAELEAERPHGPPAEFFRAFFSPPGTEPRGPPPSFFHVGSAPSGHVSPFGWHNGKPHGEKWRHRLHTHLKHVKDMPPIPPPIAFAFDGATTIISSDERRNGGPWHHVLHHGWHHCRHHHPILGFLLIFLVCLTVRKCCCKRRRARDLNSSSPSQTATQLQEDERMAIELQQMESQQMGITTYTPVVPAAPMQVVTPSPSDYVTPGVAVPMADDFKGVPQGFIVGTPVHLTTQ